MEPITTAEWRILGFLAKEEAEKMVCAESRKRYRELARKCFARETGSYK